MAITLDRTSITLTNDTGTPASPVGDGTLLSAANRVALLDAIDDLFDGTRSATFTLGTLLAVESFGTHTFSAGGTGQNSVRVRNTTSGTTMLSAFDVGNNSTGTLGRFMGLSSAYTTSGYLVASAAVLEANGAGGLSIACTDAAGDIRLYTNSTLRLTVNEAGVITPSSATILAGFFAYNSASDAGVANNTDIDFDTEVYDEGGHFSGDTFTAPVTGRYLLSAHVRLTNSTGGAIVMQPIFQVSNHSTGINIGYSSVANGATIGFSGAVIVDMDAADTATVRYYGGGNCTVEGDATQRYTWFSGRLLL